MTRNQVSGSVNSYQEIGRSYREIGNFENQQKIVDNHLGLKSQPTTTKSCYGRQWTSPSRCRWQAAQHQQAKVFRVIIMSKAWETGPLPIQVAAAAGSYNLQSLFFFSDHPSLSQTTSCILNPATPHFSSSLPFCFISCLLKNIHVPKVVPHV